MIDYVQNIYTAFGTIVNNEDMQSIYYNGDRELIFYACNESENRGKIDRNDITGLHGIFCVKQSYNERDYFEDEILPCDGVRENICTLANIHITVNIYSDFDECMQIADNLKRFFKLSPIVDRLARQNIAIIKLSDTRRLDQIIKERYEYRSQFDIDIDTQIAQLAMEIPTWDKMGIKIDHCNGITIEEDINKNERDCRN